MNLEQAIKKLKKISPLKITISGDIGAGKSTFAKTLAEELDIPRIYIGQFMREEAAKRGITLDKLSKLQEKDSSIDQYFDQLQKDRSKLVDKAIFEGRTSWYFVENPTVRIFLAVDPDTATNRIWGDYNNIRDRYSSKDELKKANQERKKSEIIRYQKYYGIDAYDTNNFDIVIDTSDITIDQVFEKGILEILDKLG